MYTTVSSLHVALDIKIQQISSNRKKSILPQQLDIILNDAVYEYINTRFTDRLNPVRQGFEENTRRYSELQLLKREVNLKLWKDNTYPNRMYTILPSDFLHYVSSKSLVLFNQNGVSYTPANKVYTLAVMPLHDMGLDGETVIIQLNDTDEEYPNVYKQTKTEKGKFYIFNTVVDKFRSMGMNCYLDDFNGKYINGSIFVTDFILHDTRERNFSCNVKTKADCPDRFMYGFNEVSIVKQVGDIISPNDLMHTETLQDVSNNLYGSRKRHQNPMCDVNNYSIRVYHDNTFIPTNVILTYIKRPRMINIDTNTMCDFEIGEEILNIAARKAISYLGVNNQYQVRNVETMPNN
jgi:hypothetical protein